jgi:hypothetical protein
MPGGFMVTYTDKFRDLGSLVRRMSDMDAQDAKEWLDGGIVELINTPEAFAAWRARTSPDSAWLLVKNGNGDTSILVSTRNRGAHGTLSDVAEGNGLTVVGAGSTGQGAGSINDRTGTYHSVQDGEYFQEVVVPEVQQISGGVTVEGSGY